MAEKDAVAMFDWGLYGAVVRKRRIELGYKKAEHFAESVWRRVRFEISRDSLYKIEQGKQIPTGMQTLAINMALFGSPFPDELFEICASRGWKKIARNVHAANAENDGDYESVDMTLFVPDQWKRENFNHGLLEGGYVELVEDDNPDGPFPVDLAPTPSTREMAYELNDARSLFLD